MRRLLTLTIFVALVLGGLWLGGETLLARELRRIAEGNPALSIADVTELRETGRIGVHMSGLHLTRAEGALDLPEADLWLSPLAPTEAHLDLPAQAVIDSGHGAVTLGLGSTDARMRLRPLGGMALDRIALGAGPLTLDRAPLADGLELNGSHVAPATGVADAAAAYDIDLSVRRLDLVRLVAALSGDGSRETAIPSALQLEAQGRVWLDAAPGPGHLTPETRPAVLALRLEGARVTLGPLGARLIGQVSADETGHAQGLIALYTPDAAPLLQLAADLGWLPQGVVKLAGRMLKGMGELPMPAMPADTGPELTFPAPAKGELRLPLTLSGGRMSLGPIPLGPAPRLR